MRTVVLKDGKENEGVVECQGSKLKSILKHRDAISAAPGRRAKGVLSALNLPDHYDGEGLQCTYAGEDESCPVMTISLSAICGEVCSASPVRHEPALVSNEEHASCCEGAAVKAPTNPGSATISKKLSGITCLCKLLISAVFPCCN